MRNVSVMKNLWDEKPNRVEVLSDKKLIGSELVIIRKKILDEFLAIEEPERIIDKYLETITATIDLIQLLVLDDERAVNSKKLKSSLEILFKINKKIG